MVGSTGSQGGIRVYTASRGRTKVGEGGYSAMPAEDEAVPREVVNVGLFSRGPSRPRTRDHWDPASKHYE